MQIALPCCFKIEFGAQAKIQLPRCVWRESSDLLVLQIYQFIRLPHRQECR